MSYIKKSQTMQDLMNNCPQLWRALVENAPVMIMNVAKDGTILYMNKVVSGLSLEEVIGKNVKDYILPQHMPILTSAMEAVFQTGNPASYEVSGMGPGGTIAQYFTYIGPLYCDNEIVSLVHVITNISERNTDRNKLSDQEEKYFALFEEALDGIVLINIEDGSILDCNPEFTKQTGRNLSQLREMKIWEIRPPEKQEDARKMFFAVKQQGYGQSSELEFQKPNGDLIYIEFKAKSINMGNRRYILSISRDISEKKQIEKALRENELTLIKVIDQMPIMLAAYNNENTILIWNKECERVTGYSAQEVIGTSAKLNHLFTDFHTKSRAFNGFNEDPAACTEVEIIRKDGERRIIAWSDVSKQIPISGWNSWIIGMDITECKRTEQEINMLKEELNHAQKIGVIGMLISGVAHDINNILGSIMMISTNIQNAMTKSYEPWFEGQRQNHDCQILGNAQLINEACKRGRDVVNNLLNFVRKEQTTFTEINPYELINNIKKFLNSIVPSNIDINIITNNNLVRIKGDPSQLHNALMNICFNAFDAIGNKTGTLTISCDNVGIAEDRIYDTAGPASENYLRIKISDNGAGMNAQTLNKVKVFEPFFTTKPKGRGTGLGLAMVSHTIKSHGGKISIESEEGIGTSVTILLPSFPVHDPAFEANISTQKLTNIKASILLADDDAYILPAIKKILEANGFKVYTAANGREAVEIYQTYHANISLVILDLIMPEKNGAETLKLIQKINPDVSALIISGYNSHILIDQAMNSGAKGFLQKPFELNDLLKLVNQVLN